GSCQSLANLIRACQTAQVAGFTLGARNKKTHARGWGAGGVNNSVHTAGGNNRQRHDCKQRFIEFHKLLLFKIRFGPEFHVCNGAAALGRLLEYSLLSCMPNAEAERTKPASESERIEDLLKPFVMFQCLGNVLSVLPQRIAWRPLSRG